MSGVAEVKVANKQKKKKNFQKGIGRELETLETRYKTAKGAPDGVRPEESRGSFLSFAHPRLVVGETRREANREEKEPSRFASGNLR